MVSAVLVDVTFGSVIDRGFSPGQWRWRTLYMIYDKMMIFL